jgi:hypothetical protein
VPLPTVPQVRTSKARGRTGAEASACLPAEPIMEAFKPAVKLLLVPRHALVPRLCNRAGTRVSLHLIGGQNPTERRAVSPSRQFAAFRQQLLTVQHECLTSDRQGHVEDRGDPFNFDDLLFWVFPLGTRSLVLWGRCASLPCELCFSPLPHRSCELHHGLHALFARVLACRTARAVSGRGRGRGGRCCAIRGVSS